jgi:hypothetical protein
MENINLSYTVVFKLCFPYWNLIIGYFPKAIYNELFQAEQLILLIILFE